MRIDPAPYIGGSWVLSALGLGILVLVSAIAHIRALKQARSFDDQDKG